MSEYTRVLPRDLFNEAKLLKCLGRLVLKTVDGQVPDLTFEHHNVIFSEGEIYKGFDVSQNPDSGDLYVWNLRFYFKEQPIYFESNYNCKSPYPLTFIFQDRFGDSDINCGAFVFDDDGEFSEEFKKLLGLEDDE